MKAVSYLKRSNDKLFSVIDKCQADTRGLIVGINNASMGVARLVNEVKNMPLEEDLKDARKQLDELNDKYKQEVQENQKYE